MTQPQRIQTKFLWEEYNPGFQQDPAEPEDIEKFREYALKVIKEDHLQQWESAAKRGKL